MPWYYASNNQRLGPVNDAEFERLAREKIIREDTLVWKYGMPDWKTLAEVESTLPPSEARPTASVEPTAADVRPALSAENVTTASVEPLAYAGFWVRVFAKFADLFVLSVLVMIVANMMHRMPSLPDAPDVDDLKKFLTEMGALSRITITTELLYSCLFLWLFQATPGKLLFGLKIVNQDGSVLSPLRILCRFLAEMLNRMLFSFGYLSAAFDPEKRAMHDFLCNTRVIKKKRK